MKVARNRRNTIFQPRSYVQEVITKYFSKVKFPKYKFTQETYFISIYNTIVKKGTKLNANYIQMRDYSSPKEYIKKFIPREEYVQNFFSVFSGNAGAIYFFPKLDFKEGLIVQKGYQDKIEMMNEIIIDRYITINHLNTGNDLEQTFRIRDEISEDLKSQEEKEDEIKDECVAFEKKPYNDNIFSNYDSDESIESVECLALVLEKREEEREKEENKELKLNLAEFENKLCPATPLVEQPVNKNKKNIYENLPEKATSNERLLAEFRGKIRRKSKRDSIARRLTRFNIIVDEEENKINKVRTGIENKEGCNISGYEDEMVVAPHTTKHRTSIVFPPTPRGMLGVTPSKRKSLKKLSFQFIIPEFSEGKFKSTDTFLNKHREIVHKKKEKEKLLLKEVLTISKEVEERKKRNFHLETEPSIVSCKYNTLYHSSFPRQSYLRKERQLKTQVYLPKLELPTEKNQGSYSIYVNNHKPRNTTLALSKVKNSALSNRSSYIVRNSLLNCKYEEKKTVKFFHGIRVTKISI